MSAHGMDPKMRIMTERPLNAETPRESLRSWITANSKFFARNQSEIMKTPIALSDWELTVDGAVARPMTFRFEELLQLPRGTVANTLECSGNSRSLLKEKARGNPWTIGGVGNAVYGGVWLKDLLEKAAHTEKARHVSFDGFDKPLGKAGIKFIRSIPIAKAMSSTLLAFEMNGEPLPVKHGFPLRALALGWTGANCVKWLSRITLLEAPYQGFFMDDVYRVFQKGQAPQDGEVVTALKIKSIITQPEPDARLPMGPVVILGSAYAGEASVEKVAVSTDGGTHWAPAEFIGPHAPYAWRQWQYVWTPPGPGTYTLLSRATDADGVSQPWEAQWNVLGYGNNGVSEHAVTVIVQ